MEENGRIEMDRESNNLAALPSSGTVIARGRTAIQRLVFGSVMMSASTIVAFGTAGCRESTRGDRTSTFGFHEPIAKLETSFSPGQISGGWLRITAVLADSLHEIPAEARLAVEARTSSGDHELLLLMPHVCADRTPMEGRAVVYPCGGFFVTAVSPEVLDTLGARGLAPHSRVDERSRRPTLRSAYVIVDSGTVSAAMQRVRSFPGLIAVERSSWGCAPPGSCPRRRVSMMLGVDVQDVAACVGDGAVQAHVGDTIRVTHVRPARPPLSAAAVVTETTGRFLGEPRKPVTPCSDSARTRG